MFFAGLNKSLVDKAPFDGAAFESKVKNWEWAWVNGHAQYSDKASGNAVDVAGYMFKKYNGVIVKAYK